MLPVVIATDTDGTRTELTVTVMAELVATNELAQGALEFKIHVTRSPFDNVFVVNVVPLLPVFAPFTCH